jgi:hypothetical protein
MKLHLVRKDKNDKCTTGTLSVDGVFECYTLEDPVRDGPKQYGNTAIPAGTYQVKITYSPRFKRDLPLLLDVPGFEGVRIHTGNSAADTEGCILVGQVINEAVIWKSRAAFDALFVKMKQASEIELVIE